MIHDYDCTENWQVQLGKTLSVYTSQYWGNVKIELDMD